MNIPSLTFTHILWALGIASAYALWSIVGKYLHIPGAWVTIIVLAGTLTGGVGVAYLDAREQQIPSVAAIALLFFVSFFNGVGVHFQATKVVDPLVPTVSFITIIIILMLVMTPAYNFLLNGEELTVRQWAGLGLALLTVFVLVG